MLHAGDELFPGCRCSGGRVLDRGNPRDMIEFTAECGHTVRAKDDAAGEVVRCTYCGNQVEVPLAEARSLDYLFRDVEQSDEEPKRRKRKRKKPRRKSDAGCRKPGNS